MRILLSYILFGFYFFSWSQTDVIRGNISVSINPQKKIIEGFVEYFFTAKNKYDTLFVDAHKIDILKIELNRKKTNYIYNGDFIKIISPFKKKNKVRIFYKAKPKKAIYFIGWKNQTGLHQIWTQGQGKNNSYWVPSFDNANEKVIFSMKITFNNAYTVLSNGILTHKKIKKNHTTWHYKMTLPMSSYLLAIVISKYKKVIEYTKRNIPIENYYLLSDSIKYQETYKYTTRIIDFLENEIEIPYIWGIYRQAPVRDFIYGGMENTTLTVFPDTNMARKQSYIIHPFLTVSAHEIAHHWFGNMVTAKNSKHHWLQEGLATYYALLAEKDILGETHYLDKIFEIASRLYMQNQKLINDKASSFTYYQKGAYVLHLLHDYIGEKNFKTGIKTYLETYKFKSADSDDFIKIMEKISQKDLSRFYNTWIKTNSFPQDEIYQNMLKYPYLKSALKLLRKPEIIKNTQVKANFGNLKNQILLSQKQNSKNLADLKSFETALSLKPEIQISALEYIDSIPLLLKDKIERLLMSKNEKIKYTSLIKLSNQFPNNIPQYLEQTETNYPFYKIIWLYYATLINYKNNKLNYISELENFTSETHPYLYRKKAFETLQNLNVYLSDQVLKNLLQGCTHHYWGFKKYCRDYLKIIYNKTVMNQINSIFTSLNNKTQQYLKNSFDL